MLVFSRLVTTAGLAAIPLSLLCISSSPAQKKRRKVDFAARQQAIKQRFERNKRRARNNAVHQPPLITASKSDLGDDEPVIGVSLNQEARAYPLTMLFGGGGIFELLNDTCGGEPLAASW